MDPRHPELAIERMIELMTQFNLILKDMKKSIVSSQLGQLEREGSLVVQEICLVAPRLHEALIQISRQRRYDLSHGIAFGYIPEEKPVEQYVAPNQAETVIVEPKYKKKTSKKKKAKK